jgi:hypothetical protein
MQKVTINPSIAVELNIDAIGQKEIVPIYFTAEQDWVGTYKFELWNSDKKNTEISIPTTPIEIDAKVMTLTIKPENQEIPVGNHYFEITKIEDKRVVFKGNLHIVN